MKCVAVYDMFVSEYCFIDAIKTSGLFDEYEVYGWKSKQTPAEGRATIREMETKGSHAFQLDQDLIEAMRDADVLLTHMVMVPNEVLDHNPRLKYVCSCRGGLENIDIDSAKRNNIKVLHVPHHNAIGVAEFCIGLMLCETRNIARSDHALKNGKWREQYPNSARITELRSMTIGIIGFGTIGRIVAAYAKAFGAYVIANDPYQPDETLLEVGIEPVSKSVLLKQADIVTLHGRISPTDPPLIGAAELAEMKSTAYLINTARATLVDMNALVEALRKHEIMGAAVDVFPSEPVTSENPITSLDNVTITSHRGGTTVESFERSPELVLSELQTLLDTGNSKFLVR